MSMTEVTLTFHLNEEVTPSIFARKVALACAYRNAIREGESVEAGGYLYEFIGLEKVDLFGKGELITVPHMGITRR